MPCGTGGLGVGDGPGEGEGFVQFRSAGLTFNPEATGARPASLNTGCTCTFHMLEKCISITDYSSITLQSWQQTDLLNSMIYIIYER